MNNKKLYKNQQSLNIAIKNICDILRRSNCTSALQYIPELTWILFLRLLDEKDILESNYRNEAPNSAINHPYRWQDWAFSSKTSLNQAIFSEYTNEESDLPGNLLDFVNNRLFPYLKSLKYKPNATPKHIVISEIFSNINRTQIDTENNLLDVLEKVNQIEISSIDKKHIFAISQAYEGLLLRMGEKKNDGGQFFTPREIIRTVIKVINPKPGETIYDPCCGTGGFLVQAYEDMQSYPYIDFNPETIDIIKNKSFFGREKDNLVYPITLANMIIHGIDFPHIWHGNTLTNQSVFDGLFTNSPDSYDIILTNPPFGGKEGKDAQNDFSYKTGATQILFLQHIIDKLNHGGRCGIVVDEGVLFRTNDAFTQTKKRLLQECNLWCIVSLPVGVFSNAGTSIKTNILFFTKGEPTKKIWYYDLSDIKITRKNPLTLDLFDDFFRLLERRGISARSWVVNISDLEKQSYDLKAVNPHSTFVDTFGTVDELVNGIEEEAKVIWQSLQDIKKW